MTAQVHRSEARFARERALRGWLGSRARAARARRRLSRAIVAAEFADHLDEGRRRAEAFEDCDCDLCGRDVRDRIGDVERVWRASA